MIGRKLGSYFERIESYKATLWKGEKPFLAMLDMELTERCDNSCIHCYINLPANDFQAKERELTTEEVEENLQEASALGCLMVRFTGGEPLLEVDLTRQFIQSFKNEFGADFHIHLYTGLEPVPLEAVKILLDAGLDELRRGHGHHLTDDRGPAPLCAALIHQLKGGDVQAPILRRFQRGVDVPWARTPNDRQPRRLVDQKEVMS